MGETLNSNLEKREPQLQQKIEVDHETFMRGEPIEAMDFTLTYGLRPERYRKKIGQPSNKRNDDDVHKSHRPERVSLGKGNLHENVASLKKFGGGGNIIYIIDKTIKYSKTFRPNSKHPNNAEFLIKGVRPDAIKGIIVHNQDVERVKEKLEAIKQGLTEGKILPSPSFDIQKAISFIESLPIISFESQMEREIKNKII